MRPLRLEMTAFGPYKEKTVLDFRNLKNQNLFLVCGPTGSGKTTIFDAIAYALYDDASGESRSKDTFKSQFATDQELCEVTFLFELKGKEYTIIRAPKQTGPGKRSGTVKNYDSTVAFYHDGKVTTKIKEANEEIVQLLSLSYNQFKQIVMLPQGEFKRLLESDSKNKEEIFRDIFRTELILSFQETLKKQAAHLRKDAEASEITLQSAFDYLSDTEDEELKNFMQIQNTEKVLERLDELAKNYTEKDSLLLTSLKQIESNLLDSQTKITEWTKYEALMVENEQLKTSADKFSQLQTKVANFRKGQVCLDAKKQKDNLQTELNQLQITFLKGKEKIEEISRNLLHLNESFASVEEQYKELPEWRQKKESLAYQKEKLLQLEKLEEEKEQLEEHQKNSYAEQKDLKEKLKETKETQTRLQEETQEIRIAQDELWKKKELKRSLQDSFAQLKNKENEIMKLEQLVQELEISITTMKQSQQEYEKQSELLINQRILYNNNIAGILASDLVEGAACPVCGSYEHPSPAQHIFGAPSEEQLEQMEKERDLSSNFYLEKSAAVAGVKQRIKESEEALGFPFAALKVESEKVSELLKDENQNIYDIKEEIEKLEKKVAEDDAVHSQLEACLQQERITELKSKEIQTNITNWKTRSEALEAEKKELLPETFTLDFNVVVSQLDEYSFKINELEKQYPLMKNEIYELDKALTGQKSTVLSFHNQIEVLEERLEKAHQHFLSTLEEAGFTEDFEDDLLSETEANQKERLLNDYQDSVKFTSQNLAAQKELIDSYGPEMNAEVLESRRRQLQEEKTDLESEISTVRMFLQTIQKGHSSIQKIQKKIQKVLERYQRVQRLSEIANGTSKETGRMSFERYVLAIYYEEIVKAANIRLQQMTADRYLLLRTEEQGKGAGAKGLELDVFDHYTGQTRSVKTLSGGESFKASLALALGLSDVMQTQSGGIQIDTLFIDEGFGTLDSESLDNAIQTLAELNARGRIVGVISHVDELKTRIPAHIEVTHTADGSHAKITV